MVHTKTKKEFQTGKFEYGVDVASTCYYFARVKYEHKLDNEIKIFYVKPHDQKVANAS